MNFVGLIKKFFEKKKKNIEAEQVELEYLFEIYNCDSIEVLEKKCPKTMNASNIDINTIQSFKELIKNTQEKEIESINNKVKERTHIKSISNFASIKEEVNN